MKHWIWLLAFAFFSCNNNDSLPDKNFTTNEIYSFERNPKFAENFIKTDILNKNAGSCKNELLNNIIRYHLVSRILQNINVNYLVGIFQQFSTVRT